MPVVVQFDTELQPTLDQIWYSSWLALVVSLHSPFQFRLAPSSLDVALEGGSSPRTLSPVQSKPVQFIVILAQT